MAAWWRQSKQPGSRFALVHRLSPAETSRITAPWYAENETRKRIEGRQLQNLARRLIGTRTISVHLELPRGIVTLHSSLVHQVVFLPGT